MSTTQQQLLLAALALMILLTLCTVWRQRKCWIFIWQLNGWRGVLHQPLLWLLLLLILDPKRLMVYLPKIRKRFKGPLAIYTGRSVWLYVDDPETMEQVFNAPECVDKTYMQDGFFTRKGLLHARGEKWKIRRKQLNPTFSTSILLSFFGTFNAVANRLQVKFDSLLGDEVKFKDVEDVLSRAVLEVACRTTMGTELNFIEGDTVGIARTYKKLLEISALKVVKPWLQNDFLFRLVDSKLYACDRECNKLMEQFVSNIVQCKHCDWKSKKKHQEQQLRHAFSATKPITRTSQPRRNVEDEAVSIGSSNGSADADMQQVLENCDYNNNHGEQQQQHRRNHQHPAQVQLQHQLEEATESWQQKRRIFIEQIFHLAENGELTLQDIIDESQSMILVAFETVSNSILIALLCLAIHPECQDKLRHEISDIFSTATTNSSAEELNTPPAIDISNEHLKQMKYLDMIVNESLRLLTTVPMNLRNVSRDFQLIRKEEAASKGAQRNTAISINVPEGTIILLDIFNMQRDAMQWGSRSEQFYPEHFAATTNVEDTIDGSENAEKKRRHSYAFAPFSKGLRWCIGWRYSIWLTKIMLIKIVRCYEFSTTTKLEDLRFVEGISLKFLNCDSITFSIRKIQQNNKAK